MRFDGYSGKLRRRFLPPGWYPDDPAGVARAVLASDDGKPRGNAAACVCPHAGWEFSGSIAARTMRALRGTARTVAIIGGHRPAGSDPLIGVFGAVEIPGGAMPVDADLLDLLLETGLFAEDRYADNTVEALVPMAAFLFPQARLVWLRFPASMESFDLGKELGRVASSLGRDAVAIGSTDLTHYGPNYGFSPHGAGAKAEAWVRNVNDAAFIRAVLSSDPASILGKAEEDSSACSAGAVLGVLGFAQESGAGRAELVAYGTSADVHPSASFVGYGGIAWYPGASESRDGPL